jgi:hypothetical protein
MRPLRPIERIYWLRLALGIVAAVLCAAYAVAANQLPVVTEGPDGMQFEVNYSLFFYTVDIAIIIYILSYYIMKPRFINKVEKQQKIFTTGIGIYFIAWLVFWALFYTILTGPPIPVA